MAEAKSKWDYINEAAVTMGEVHANIHRGIFFSGGYGAEGIADDGTLILLVQTGASQSAHLRYAGSAGGDHRVEFFEDTTVSAAGTAIACSNRNRFSSNVCAATVTHTPTVTGVGTELINSILPGGTAVGQGQTTPGSSATGFSEWVLKHNTIYMLRITNLAGTAQPLSASVDFYEPDLEN
jgi:hypothetical protein